MPEKNVVGKNVLVTGANGHLGYNLVLKLVQRGYNVRAGVRDSLNENKIAPLKKLRVEIVELDIEDYKLMNTAAEGMDGIFHVAAVFKFGLKDPEKEIIQPIVNGALNALKSAKSQGIGKVIYTSSSVTLGNISTEEDPLNEDSWNTTTKVPYQMAKTRAEQEAWEFAKENNINFISINPGLILGPNFYKLTPSTEVIANIVNGNLPSIPPISFNTVDVRDAADLHISAYEKVDAHGRYIAASGPVTMKNLFDLVKDVDPDIKVPRFTMPRIAFINYARVSSFLARIKKRTPLITTQQAKEYSEGDKWLDISRTKSELGWEPRLLTESINDTINWLKISN